MFTESVCLKFDKIWVGPVYGRFFSKTFGNPGPTAHFLARFNFQQKKSALHFFAPKFSRLLFVQALPVVDVHEVDRQGDRISL
jgi:hypothetical protein